MEKFLKIDASTTGPVLVGLNNIVRVAKGTATTTTITYNGAAAQDVITITHTSDSTTATAVKIQDAILDALRPSNNPQPFKLLADVTVTPVAVA